MMDKDLIVREFYRIKELGFVKSRRQNNTGIGKTFEDYLGVKENNDKAPDFAGFEVKSKRAKSTSYLTLFTKSPSVPKKANTYLRDTYGDAYEENPDLKKIHTSIFSDKYNTYRDLFQFKIINDANSERVVINIKDISSGQIDSSVYWTYKELETCLIEKMKALFFVYAETQIIDGTEHFHYTNADIYLNPSLKNLLKFIDDGKLMIDIRIGSYKTGKSKGKTHDHGTGFRIKPCDLTSLYEKHIQV